MMPDVIRQTTAAAMQQLQLFNQNTLHFCHNMLRHLPRNKSAFYHANREFDTDRVGEIESFLLDQTERLIDLSKDNRVNPDFGIDVTALILRNDTEKRFVALLNHFINYSKKHNPKVYDGLYVEYSDGTSTLWDKNKIDELGGRLKGRNPIKLFNFAKAVANSADPEGTLHLSPPVLKEPSKELKLKDEQEKVLMTLIDNGPIEIRDDMSEEEFDSLVAEIMAYSEGLKFKENSIKLRQETLMSIYHGNPSGEVKDMILGTNAMTMDLKREQLILSDVVKIASDHAIVHGFSHAEQVIDQINDNMNQYTLLNDDKLAFIIQSEKLDSIKNRENSQEHSLSVGGI